MLFLLLLSCGSMAAVVKFTTCMESNAKSHSLLLSMYGGVVFFFYALRHKGTAKLKDTELFPFSLLLLEWCGCSCLTGDHRVLRRVES